MYVKIEKQKNEEVESRKKSEYFHNGNLLNNIYKTIIP